MKATMKSTAVSDRAWLLATALLIVFWMMSTHAEAGAFPGPAARAIVSLGAMM
jgi:hypothetical protein